MLVKTEKSKTVWYITYLHAASPVDPAVDIC